VSEAEEADRLAKQLGVRSPGERTFAVAAIAWLEGDTQKARTIYTQMQERFSLFGDKVYKSICVSQLGLLAMEEGDLSQAQAYLEQGLLLSREVGSQVLSAIRLIQLSNLFYLQGNLEAFKQSAREGLSLRKHFLEAHKVLILEIILGSLYVEKPKSSAQILGAINDSEKESDLLPEPITVLYCARAEAHTREVLGDAVFNTAFADGQKMSLDEGLDLALKTVEEM
jgi:ATP/maltotriose-dependent transcriptional regulator MalT